MYSLWDYVCDCLDMLLAFRRILDCRLPIWDDLLWQNRFLDDLQKLFEVWEYTCIVYVPTPLFVFFYRRKQLNRYFEGLCMFLLLRFGMIDNPRRFKDDAWTVIWLFPCWRLGICRFRENCQKRIGFKTIFMSLVFSLFRKRAWYAWRSFLDFRTV